MYAIVEINGQQFKAEAGKKLFVHHIQNAENGATVEFDKVLLVDKDGNITVGAPTVEGAKVVCQVVSNMVKGDKVLVECTVEAVFVQSGMAMVKTRDCDNGFDAYVDEIKGVVNE